MTKFLNNEPFFTQVDVVVLLCISIGLMASGHIYTNNVLLIIGFVLASVFTGILVVMFITAPDPEPEDDGYEFEPDLSRWEKYGAPVRSVLVFIKDELVKLKTDDIRYSWYWEIKEKIINYVIVRFGDDTYRDLDDSIKETIRQEEPLLKREIRTDRQPDAPQIQEIKDNIISKFKNVYGEHVEK